ncbi:MAG: cell division protein FtsZ [Bacteroidales bacterium]|nr:cell division protein FtsZ [Bacteroidales bacterium]
MNEFDELTFETTSYGEVKKPSIIKVVGIGGAGGNAVQHMYEEGIVGVDFFLCNTDEQALQENKVSTTLKFGKSGLGAGSDPVIARQLAEESEEEIRQMIGEDTKMLFITAGMGKGTGTGASPVVARIAREMGILTIAVVTYPYKLEQKKCCLKADEGIAELRKYVDSLIVIQNQKVMETYRRETLPAALAHADDVLKNAVKCIAELITVAGYQNVDFNDVVSILKGSGEAMLGLAEVSGENRIEEVISKAMTCNLIDDNHITDAQNFLFFLRYGEDQELTVDELFKLSEEFEKYQNEDTHVIWGHAADKGLGDKLKLSVIITKYNRNTLTPGIPQETQNQSRPDDMVIPVTSVQEPAAAEESFPAEDPTLFDTLPSDETKETVTDNLVTEQPVTEAVEAQEKEENPFDSSFFQQPNVPEEARVLPSLVSEEQGGRYTVLPHTPQVSHAQPARAIAQSGIVVTDNGDTDYDDDQKFNDLVNRPAWQTAIQDSRIVDVQTPSMQKTVQPEYTSQSVFFGLVGGANAD